VNKGEAAVGLVLPPGLSEDFKRQRGAEVLLIINGTNYIVANTAYAKASEILQTLNAGIAIKTLEGKGFLSQEAQKTVQAIKLEQKILYNPDYNYAYYLTYGVLGVGVFSLLMSAISVTLSRQGKSKGFTASELAAKLIVYGGFACIMTNVIFRLAQVIFKLPAKGFLGGFFGLTFFYGYLIVLFALLLWVVAVDEVRIFQAGVFFATPLFFITGYTWPLDSIPWFMHFLYWLCPFTPFLNGVRASLVMGAGYQVVFKYMLWELALIAVYLPIVWLVYKKRLVICRK
ncbi:MAG: ABC transporter permease, partial [Clostridia bacterium]|nr:ABC transporter permease [Clostridia bacterium]